MAPGLLNGCAHSQAQFKELSMGLIAFLIIGLLAGLLARALMPGNQGMGWVGTLLLGVVGSFVGGLLGSMIRSDGNWMAFQPSGLIWSTLGALVVLGIAALVRGRSGSRA